MPTATHLPAFYGKPIDTPAGHEWAGYATQDPATFALSHVEQYAANNYSTPEKRQAHARLPITQEISTCEFCGVPEDDDCADTCGCHACERERALDESADQYIDNIND